VVPPAAVGALGGEQRVGGAVERGPIGPGPHEPGADEPGRPLRRLAGGRVEVAPEPVGALLREQERDSPFERVRRDQRSASPSAYSQTVCVFFVYATDLPFVSVTTIGTWHEPSTALCEVESLGVNFHANVSFQPP